MSIYEDVFFSKLKSTVDKNTVLIDANNAHSIKHNIFTFYVKKSFDAIFMWFTVNYNVS